MGGKETIKVSQSTVDCLPQNIARNLYSISGSPFEPSFRNYLPRWDYEICELESEIKFDKTKQPVELGTTKEFKKYVVTKKAKCLVGRFSCYLSRSLL